MSLFGKQTLEYNPSNIFTALTFAFVYDGRENIVILFSLYEFVQIPLFLLYKLNYITSRRYLTDFLILFLISFSFNSILILKTTNLIVFGQSGIVFLMIGLLIGWNISYIIRTIKLKNYIFVPLFSIFPIWIAISILIYFNTFFVVNLFWNGGKIYWQFHELTFYYGLIIGTIFIFRELTIKQVKLWSYEAIKE